MISEQCGFDLSKEMQNIGRKFIVRESDNWVSIVNFNYSTLQVSRYINYKMIELYLLWFKLFKVYGFFQCCGSGSESGSGSTCFWASRIRIHQSEVWIRIRRWIRIRILLSSCKNSKKNLDSYYFVTLFDFLSLKNDVNVPSKSNKQKKLCKKISFLLASWRSMTKIAGSGSTNQRHGSADPDPDPPQNVMDPQHWFFFLKKDWSRSATILDPTWIGYILFRTFDWDRYFARVFEISWIIFRQK